MIHSKDSSPQDILIKDKMMSFKTPTEPALVTADDQSPPFGFLAEERRGSLPFKKRRLMEHGFGPLVSQTSLVSAYSATAAMRFLKEPTNYEANKAAAALALLAAASGALTKMMPSTTSSTIGSTTTAPPSLPPLLALSQAAEIADRRTPPPSTSLFFDASSVVRPTIHDPPAAVGPSPVTPMSGEDPAGGQPPLLSSSDSSSSAKARVHHPPLSNPLPNGCHGRTSRNNSFCRRTPCYNASRYCKLHYQQYIVAGTRVPVGPAGSSGIVSESTSVTSTPTVAHQDKRFTGCADEVRCTATTTRGRACAYVSITDGKYCHLHADYDTNPPPRRGGGGSSSAGSNKSRPSLLSSAKAGSSMNILPRMEGCPVIPDLGTSKAFSGTAPLKPSILTIDILSGAAVRQSPPSVSSDDSVSSPPPSKSKNNAENPHASQALLSSVSSDQWLNHKVIIGTGPLVNRTGTVEKWGNGWVTIRVCQGLTHNRRSVELYLVPEESCSSDESAEDKTTTTSGQVIPHCVSYEKDAKQDTADLDTNSGVQFIEHSQLRLRAQSISSLASGVEEPLQAS